MSGQTSSNDGGASFDSYAEDYDGALNRGISVSGESKDYFASGRVRWLAGQLACLSERPRTILDFGCGTGSATPHLERLKGVQKIVGVDVSRKSVEKARHLHGSSLTTFATLEECAEGSVFDLIFCNGVFHHIPPGDRAAALDYIRSRLRPGGLFCYFENNPWNPGTRYVMSRIPFDRDAVTLTPPESRQMLSRSGFMCCQTDFLFFFPRFLAFLRPLEPKLKWLPFGAQYMVLCRKLDTASGSQ